MNFEVRLVTRNEVKNFIETYHYSHNINGCITDYCFALYDEDRMVGALFYGRMAMANQWRKFSDKEENVIELRRLVCIDDTPKNTESFFIGSTLRMLSQVWRKDGIVVSYADKEYGHLGTIYRASNFTLGDEILGAKVIVHNGKQYHDKAIRTKYKGRLKPFAARLNEALLSGEASYKKTLGKFTFIYYLDKRVRKNKCKSP